MWRRNGSPNFSRERENCVLNKIKVKQNKAVIIKWFGLISLTWLSSLTSGALNALSPHLVLPFIL